MSESKFKKGQFFWSDLTVPDATSLKEFYKEVIGWQEQEVPMKDNEETYADYAMTTDDGAAVSGICNQRSVNKNIPPQWIMYVNVDNVAESLEKVLQLGGKLIAESKKKDGSYNYVIVQDPVGAVFGLGTTN